MSQIFEWAANEVEIALEKAENETERAAIKTAFASLTTIHDILNDIEEDVRPSMNVVNMFLKQLMNFQPLTPIEDNPEDWELDRTEEDGTTISHHKRLPTLTECVRADQKRILSDSGRYYCFDILNSDQGPYSGGLPGRVLDDIAPIGFPYLPVGKACLFTKNFRVFDEPDLDDKVAGWDTVGIIRVKMADGTIHEVNKFFKLSLDGIWQEIPEVEYDSRFKKYQARMKKES